MNQSTACPSWCTQSAAHPFSPPLFPGEVPSRLHRARVATSADGRLAVELVAFESQEARQAEPGMVVLLEYSMIAAVPSGTEFAAGEARWAAGQMVAAADLVEVVR